MKQSVKMDTFTYGCINRPPMYGTVPAGWTNNQPHQDYSYGTIDYDHKLSVEDVYRYELAPVSANAYKYQVGQRVLVNGCDEAIVTTLGWHGRYDVDYVEWDAHEGGLQESEIEPLE